VVVEVPDDAVLMADNCSIRDVLDGGSRARLLVVAHSPKKLQGEGCPGRLE
jgi:hypothetical protein